MMKIPKYFSVLILIVVSGGIIGCSKPKPVRTLAFYQDHPEYLIMEALICLKDNENHKDISKDATCNNIIAIEKDRCQTVMKVARSFYRLDCDDQIASLTRAHEGL